MSAQSTMAAASRNVAILSGLTFALVITDSQFTKMDTIAKKVAANTKSGLRTGRS